MNTPSFSWPRFLSWFLFGTLVVGVPISLLAWFFFLGDSRWEHAALVLPLAFGVLVSETSLIKAIGARRILAGIIGFIGVFGWAWVGWWYWQFSLGAQQLNNLGLVRAYGSAVEEFKEDHGRYPKTLPKISYGEVPPGLDWWGNPLRYEVKDDAFVVVSPGRGGTIETENVWGLRERFKADRLFNNICGEWGADFVLTDLGFVQGCGK